jgi:hypothetical protein
MVARIEALSSIASSLSRDTDERSEAEYTYGWYSASARIKS